MVDGDRKLRPTYSLAEIKAAFAPDCEMNRTKSARIGAQSLELVEADVIDIIQRLEHPGDFEKSMRSNADHTVWQDVYKPSILINGKAITLYVKFTLDTERAFLLISFKNADDGG